MPQKIVAKSLCFHKISKIDLFATDGMERQIVRTGYLQQRIAGRKFLEVHMNKHFKQCRGRMVGAIDDRRTSLVPAAGSHSPAIAG